MYVCMYVCMYIYIYVSMDICTYLFMYNCMYYFRTTGGSKTHPESKCPELLANYCDLLLRKTPLSKKLTSEEIDEKLKSVVRKRT